MPYVKCPSCEQVTFTRPTPRSPELCGRCGDPLPLVRSVVSLSRYRMLVDDEPARDLQTAAA
jgi:hypothetical protein